MYARPMTNHKDWALDRDYMAVTAIWGRPSVGMMLWRLRAMDSDGIYYSVTFTSTDGSMADDFAQSIRHGLNAHDVAWENEGANYVPVPYLHCTYSEATDSHFITLAGMDGGPFVALSRFIFTTEPVDTDE